MCSRFISENELVHMQHNKIRCVDLPVPKKTSNEINIQQAWLYKAFYSSPLLPLTKECSREWWLGTRPRSLRQAITRSSRRLQSGLL